MTKLGEFKNFPHGAEGLDRFASPLGNVGVIEFVTDEFTCLCPKTGQPDFARIRIRYQPIDWCVESKSLKLYFWNFREIGAFHEAVTREIGDALNKLLAPKWLQVLGEFNLRGGIGERVLVSYGELGLDSLSL